MEIVSTPRSGEMQVLTADSYGIYIAILAFYLVFSYFMYPETRYHTVEEVSVIFDKRDDVGEGSHITISNIRHRSSEMCGQRKDEESKGMCFHRENE